MPLLRVPFEPEEDELTRMRNERFVEEARGGSTEEGFYVDFSWPESMTFDQARKKARVALSLDRDEDMIQHLP